MKINFLNTGALVLSICITLASCKKNGVNKASSIPVDVFITGVSGDSAIYWKNGVANLLGGIYTANSIFVSGSDIYIAGERSINGNSGAALLKDGTVNMLADETKSPVSYAYSVMGSGTDIYVAGYTYSTGNVATYWKNQSPVYVGGLWSTASSVFVSGSDVYVAGGSAISGINLNAATLWKNGTAAILTKTGEAGYATSIFVSRNDVYVAGTKYVIGAPAGSKTAAYWKNGVVTELSSNNASANAIYVAGNDVYVAGSEMVNGISVATYWKNGVATHLMKGPTESNASSIAVAGDDVYVAGNVTNTVNGFPNATYWKNGTAVTLKTTYSIAYGLYVKPVIN